MLIDGLCECQGCHGHAVSYNGSDYVLEFCGSVGHVWKVENYSYLEYLLNFPYIVSGPRTIFWRKKNSFDA